MYPLIRLFLEKHIAPQWPKQRKAYELFCDMADLVNEAAAGFATADQLRNVVNAFQEAFVAAGWAPFAHPKFHRCVHFADQFAKWRFIVSCWVLERKHKDPKQYAATTKNLAAYEKTVLHETTCRSLARLQLPDTFSTTLGLIDGIPAKRQTADMLRATLQLHIDECGDNEMMTAQRARFSLRGVCACGDAVLVKADGEAMCAGEVVVLASIRGVTTVVLRVWEHVLTDRQLFVSTHILRKELVMYELRHVVGVCIHKKYSDNRVVVLRPYGLRND